MIDLKAFCATEPWRPQLSEPWSAGERTYASDGFVMVRVPRIAEVPYVTDIFAFEDTRSKGNRIFDDAKKADHTPRPLIIAYTLPPPEECRWCEGSGKEPEPWPLEFVDCDECDGSGQEVPAASVTIGGVPFDARYIARIAALPGVRIAESPIPEKPCPFDFEDGEGVVMPRLSPAAIDLGEVFSK